MDLNKALEKINKDREKVEACFVFSCWANPELFEDYKNINTGKDETLKNDDAKFYWMLGLSMYQQGIKRFDAISIDAFLANSECVRKQYEKFGGFQVVNEMKSLVDPENVEAYFDKISKMNSLSIMAKKTDELFEHVERFDNATNEDIYNAFDLLNNSVSLATGHEAEIEDLKITQKFLDECISGENMGLSYAEGAPLLNYITLGAPIADVLMFAGHSGSGKSSWIFENMVLPISKNTKVAILSNEMQIHAYQNMLTAHILTKELDYWKLTRKKIKIGKYTDEDLAMLQRAKEISETKYTNIKFVKVFANDTSMITKYIRRLAHSGVQYFVWDTFKGDDVADGSDAWFQLLMNSRKVFNLVSKLKVSLTCTFQLALYTTNQRYLDASCLSSSKQIKEVVSELIMMRKLWDDEYTDERYDCHPYKFNKENNKIKEMITLDKDKTYYVCFVNKTRNDEGDRQVLYEWRGAWNRWYEVGYCTIRNDHRGAS